ncbi:MAG: hypothetical protein KBF12_12240 [Sebaldella sp.]|nr:hypothetical protein [Sebaldella sp.]
MKLVEGDYFIAGDPEMRAFYTIKIPIYILYNYDDVNYIKKSQYNFIFNKEFEIDEMKFNMSCGTDQDYLYIYNVIANSGQEAKEKLYDYIPKILKNFSIFINGNHVSTDNTVRFAYDREEIEAMVDKVIGSDKRVVEHSIKMECIVSKQIESNFFNIEYYFNILNEKIIFIIDTYYKALATTNFISKYYLLYTIIELIEGEFQKFIVVNKVLNKEVLKKIKENSKLMLLEEKQDNTVIEKVLEHIGKISGFTIESRAEKLEKILEEVFNFSKLEKNGVEFLIDIQFCKKIIAIRNSLFHGKIKDKKEIKIYSFKLLTLVEAIVTNVNKLEKFNM